MIIIVFCFSCNPPAILLTALEKGLSSKLEQGTSSLAAGSSNNSSSSGTHRLKGLSSNHYMKGLLEVEPLHYTCHAASDGTELEKIEPGEFWK